MQQSDFCQQPVERGGFNAGQMQIGTMSVDARERAAQPAAQIDQSALIGRARRQFIRRTRTRQVERDAGANGAQRGEYQKQKCGEEPVGIDAAGLALQKQRRRRYGQE
ncbi:MAG: hypothetical protein B7Y41_01425 [Hydrogenophilales bacterium 28-61-23]|nr:MAG: hypothetical protein B7Y41_01425 [Hydrogenophilales bacterium 28-61-23]